jgi:hypothetical protein
MMRISEITTTTPWKWYSQDDKHATALFTVGNVRYEFKAKNTQYDHIDHEREQSEYDGDEYIESKDYSGHWLIVFKATEIGTERVASGDGITMTGTGNSAQVIATITKIMGDFLFKYRDSIDVIEYDSFERSRTSLYSRLFNKFLPGWKQRPGELHNFEVVNPDM